MLSELHRSYHSQSLTQILNVAGFQIDIFDRARLLYHADMGGVSNVGITRRPPKQQNLAA